MALDHVVLGHLAAAPQHGYAVWRRIDEALGGPGVLQRSHVYLALGRLLRAGLVQVRAERPARAPLRRVYAITAAGRARLGAWLAAGVGDARSVVRRSLLVKVAVLAALDERLDAHALLAERTLREHRLRRPRPRALPGALVDARTRRHLEIELELLAELGPVSARPPAAGSR